MLQVTSCPTSSSKDPSENDPLQIVRVWSCLGWHLSEGGQSGPGRKGYWEANEALPKPVLGTPDLR